MGRGAATLCATDATCAALSAEQSRVRRVFDRAGEAAGCGVIDGVSSAKDSIRSISEMRLPEQMTAAVQTVRVSYSLQALPRSWSAPCGTAASVHRCAHVPTM